MLEFFIMDRLVIFASLSLMLMLAACSHPLTLTSVDGEKFAGHYRFGRDESGLMQIWGPDNEVLIGRFLRVGRSQFAEGYVKAFGRGTIEMDGPDLSRFGNPFAGVLGPASVFHETAYSEAVAGSAGRPAKSISGPLFYWTASLQGDRRLVLGCYFIGSSYTGHGFGRCKSQNGKEFHIDF